MHELENVRAPLGIACVGHITDTEAVPAPFDRAGNLGVGRPVVSRSPISGRFTVVILKDSTAANHNAFG